METLLIPLIIGLVIHLIFPYEKYIKGDLYESNDAVSKWINNILGIIGMATIFGMPVYILFF